ncbi:hypothetical protein [Methylacidimicrobium sp. B4]|uniref:hypothetical protein n=1 Tax=Methylacidimicrobium sp. B4 TaxID=2796139 RepID=UPI001A8FE56C|nr:hypothetical protein [Methylacidimicrobium sp. B4]QSR84098.1 hypothetical protein MacB4_07520 [Methylacidimicrobium sp. B4]
MKKRIVWFDANGLPGDEQALGPAILDRLEREPERLPLESFCEEGGWPGPWRAHIDAIRKSGSGVIVVLSVSFAERVSACCDLGSAKEEMGYHEILRYGRLEIHLEPQAGRLSVQPLP